jgi:hypothetical protein
LKVLIPFKIHQNSTTESVTEFLALTLLHFLESCSQYFWLAACKNWDFLEQHKTSISILQVEPVLGQIMKNQKPRGTNRSVTLSEQRRPTILPALGQRPPPLCRAHGFGAAALPPPVSPPPPPRP